MLIVNNVTMQFGDLPLFENITIKYGNGFRYGLIGANGSGKSTFMKILSGELEPTSGSISLESNIRLGRLQQNQFAYEDIRVLDVVMMGHQEMWKIAIEKNILYSKVNATDEDYMHAAELETKFAEYGGYTAEANASELLIGLGIPIKQHNYFMKQIAPGWKLRVLLAQVLFSNPNVLLLDEPTNHLDIHSIHWLEEILNSRNSTMIIISHDRHFLNTVCTHITDLDYRTMTVYKGNYSDYILSSTQERERKVISNNKSKERAEELKTFIRRFSANASKAKQATSRQKQLEKIEFSEIKPSSRQYPFIHFTCEKKINNVVVKCTSLSKKYEYTLFKNFNLAISRGEKVGIIGKSGVGKTTLLKSILSKRFSGIEADSGEVKWAINADIGYMPQDLSNEFIENISLFHWMKKWKKQNEEDQNIYNTLGKLLFSGNSMEKSIQNLSGGERIRMILGRFMLQRCNVLALDEPTNHMDMESINSLQTALDKYDGTVIFISHDREFISGVATRILEITTNGNIIELNEN